ncbi:hypothetical protein KAR91_59330 [Candidatus Pacearchaeota archaeon]|nr:hypothetical protein [Candidatus Pacearchaeota archaeon]
MINKKTMSVALVVLLMSLMLSGCADKGPHGTYVNENDPESFLRLNENGVYLLKQSGMVYIDHFEYDLNTVYLAAVLGAVEIERNTSKVLIDNDGERWVKK